MDDLADNMTNNNSTTVEIIPYHPRCIYDPSDPLCSNFNGMEIFELTYLMFLVTSGLFGNLLVITSILMDKKRIHKNGNIFIVNLAVADLIVTTLYLPTVIANVFHGTNALPPVLCHAAGYVVTVTCACSVSNLTFIAINRYWSVVRPHSYPKVFAEKWTYVMVATTWLWPNLIASPTLYGWSGLRYDPKIMICTFDDMASVSFNWFLIIAAIFLPVTVIVYCYSQLYKSVRERGIWLRSLQTNVATVHHHHTTQQKISLKREVELLKTVAVTIAAFVTSWTPYGLVILFVPETVPALIKQVVGWIALSNSVMNFVIYGAMNPIYRRGYNKVFSKMCACCKLKIKDRRSPKAVVQQFVDIGRHNDHIVTR